MALKFSEEIIKLRQKFPGLAKIEIPSELMNDLPATPTTTPLPPRKRKFPPSNGRYYDTQEEAIKEAREESKWAGVRCIAISVKQANYNHEKNERKIECIKTFEEWMKKTGLDHTELQELIALLPYLRNLKEVFKIS